MRSNVGNSIVLFPVATKRFDTEPDTETEHAQAHSYDHRGDPGLSRSAFAREAQRRGIEHDGYERRDQSRQVTGRRAGSQAGGQDQTPHPGRPRCSRIVRHVVRFRFLVLIGEELTG